MSERLGARRSDTTELGREVGEAFFWSIVDAAPDGIAVADAEGRIRMVNAQLEDLFGYRRRELIDQHVEVLVPEGVRDEHRGHRRRFVESPTVRPMGAGLALRARRADGSEFPVEVSLSPMRSGGELFVVAVIRDVTARVEADEQLRASERALADAERALAIADDRERIARDLHDTVIQRLFAAGLALQGVATRCEDPVRERVEGAIDEIDEAISDLRTSIFSLRTVDRSMSGLRGRILDVVGEVGAALGFEPRLQFDGPIETIDGAIAEHLLPTIREGLANVVRHASARNVRVSIQVADTVSVTIDDDGVGVPDEVVGGSGTDNVRHRASRLGGTCELTNRAEGGARLSWRVPVDPPA